MTNQNYLSDNHIKEQQESAKEMFAKIISIGNGKGGVGKSTILRYLAFTLATKFDKKTLLVDADPSANLTDSLIVTKELYSDETVEIEKTMLAGILLEDDIKDLIINCVPNLDFIPSNYDFRHFPSFLTKMYGSTIDGIDENHEEVQLKRMSVFKEMLEPLRSEYDFIFIDTPPTSSDFTNNAIFASDYLVLAFQTQADSLKGLIQYVENDITELISRYNAETDVLGILSNQMTDGAVDRKVIVNAIEHFGVNNMFENIVPFIRRVQSAPLTGITEKGRWEQVAFNDTFVPLAEEFLNRIDLIEENE